jgi:signal transduction histidine kinase
MNTRLISRQAVLERLPRLRTVDLTMRAVFSQLLRGRWRDQRPSGTGAGLPEPLFEILVGTVSVFVPVLILLPLSSLMEPTLAAIVLMVSIALATHVGEWLGGITALILTMLSIDVFWIGDSFTRALPNDAAEIVSLVVIGGAGLILAWLIQEVKGQSVSARRDAQAARSATFALNSIEADAAAYARGGIGNRSTIYHSLLRAMVAANRSAFGVLLLGGEHTELAPVAGYGLDAGAVDDLAPEFLDEILEERRVRTVFDISRDPRFDGSEFRRAGVRSLLGSPIFGERDQFAGIVVTGLHAAHAFSSAEEYRLSALTDKAASILDALEAVDERELALQKAQDRQVWLERVIGAIPEAVMLIDQRDGTILAQNVVAANLLGELTGRHINYAYEHLQTLDGEQVTADSSPIAVAIDELAVISGIELLAVRPDGAQIPVLVSAAPVRDPGDPMHAVVTVFREISALKEASRLKDEFVSVVSHELRSPLTPIRGFVQLVARDLSRKGGYEESVQRLNSAAGHVDRMTRLVDDLLDVSRLKAGLLDLRRSEVKLADICREVIRDRRAGGVRQELEFDELPIDVIGKWDADRLYQVIDNLVGNAIKYSPPDGTVRVSMNEHPRLGTASVTISDQGPGISADERDLVFSAFFRTKSATTSQVSGLGLGLYICSELVNAHGGEISVHEAESGGAAFKVTLPITAVQDRLEAVAAS